MSNFWTWFDHTVEGVRPAIAKLVFEAGFEPLHTGGGCMTWAKDLGDGTSLWVCTEDNELDGNPRAAKWLASRFDEDGGFVQIYDSMTLKVAMAAAKLIPAPPELGEQITMTLLDIKEMRQDTTPLPKA